MYFITDGRVRVHDGEIVLAHLGAGDVFGEMAVLDAEVRSASITTETATDVLVLERGDFYDALAGDPEGLQVVMRSVLRRGRKIVDDVTIRTQRLLGYEKELEIGRRIQQSFLPSRIPQLENLELASHFEAAREVAGDFFDLFKLKSGNHIALVIGDVCDKGVGAALFMTLFRSLLRASALYGYRKADDSPHEDGDIAALLVGAVRNTNDYVATTHRDSSMFASLFFGVLDADDGELVYVNAGHEAPVVYRAGGATEQLEVTGGVIGLFPGAPIRVASARIGAGDLLFAYTDGVNEAKDPEGGQFSEERILSMTVDADTTCAGFIDDVRRRIAQFRRDAAQSDDITMIAAKRLA